MELLTNMFIKSGSTRETLAENIKKITEATKDIIVRANDVSVFSQCDIVAAQVPGRLPVHNLTEATLDGLRLMGERMHVKYINPENLPPLLVKEMVEDKELLFRIGDKTFFVSNLAIPTLCARAGVGGDTTQTRQNVYRDMHLADALFSRNEKIHFVYREEEVAGKTYRKIYAAMGGTYALVPQTVVIDVLDVMERDTSIGKVEVRKWSIDHEFTRVYVEFPEAAKDFTAAYKLPDEVVPGLIITTSDIGLSSVRIEGTYRIGTRKIISSEVCHKHTLSTSAGQIVEEVDKQIFDTLRRLPETLMRLFGTYVYGDEKTDLTVPANAIENKKAVEAVLTKTAKAVIKPVLAEKYWKELMGAIIAEINPEIHYTLYDVATQLMSIPDRLSGVSESVRNKLRKAVAKVPYVIEEKEAEKLSTLILT